ncbi:helix-turn-helix transcriptional regulator [Urbifossiella limnaea]|uniref:Arabinose operon regulatory protein n=1 Tax=Urbifossiella limnaea TaxID=2528023 RepID=A0A517XNZ7_9BACT|nr:AraC family transcriptional regulator [Urbifossiella limnaea]QDU19235.1 Arabinose operon regulatory protein [Urbifossiella limnaea]
MTEPDPPPAGVAQALYDRRDGRLALEVVDAPAAELARPHRTNYFTAYWVRAGRGTFHADGTRHPFAAPCLLFLTPYQAARLDPDDHLHVTAVRFHANFLCVETHHHEVGCNGVLFNDPYGPPAVTLDESTEREVADLVARMRAELDTAGLAQAELLLSYLKILLVRATRLKRGQQGTAGGGVRLPPPLPELRELVERHYRRLHAPADYADLLHATPKALGRLVKQHLGKTLTELIRERVLNHAKWELLHTLKPVKEVAREVGFDDELYFSRLFRKATGMSPTGFRAFETDVRGGSNLSMPSARPSIPPPPPTGQNADRPASDPPEPGA